MSSHHFVKEGQEPALFIIDPISFSQVQSLLEWAPLVMVKDTALDATLSWGIKIDVVVSVQGGIGLLDEEILAQAPVKIILYNELGAAMESGFQFLIEMGQETVNVIVNTADSEFKSAQNYSEKLSVTLLEGTTKWSFIPTKQFKKWLAVNTILRTRSTTGTQTFSTQSLGAMPGGCYKATMDCLVTIESQHPFWIGEALV